MKKDILKSFNMLIKRAPKIMWCPERGNRIKHYFPSILERTEYFSPTNSTLAAQGLSKAALHMVTVTCTVALMFYFSHIFQSIACISERGFDVSEHLPAQAA